MTLSADVMLSIAPEACICPTTSQQHNTHPTKKKQKQQNTTTTKTKQAPRCWYRDHDATPPHQRGWPAVHTTARGVVLTIQKIKVSVTRLCLDEASARESAAASGGVAASVASALSTVARLTARKVDAVPNAGDTPLEEEAKQRTTPPGHAPPHPTPRNTHNGKHSQRSDKR